GGATIVAAEPPLPRKRIAVAASPSKAPPPFAPPATKTSGTNLALPSASAVTTLTMAAALEPSASTCALYPLACQADSLDLSTFRRPRLPDELGLAARFGNTSGGVVLLDVHADLRPR